jgi:hypothetical protein
VKLRWWAANIRIAAYTIIIGRASLGQSADEDSEIGPARVIIDRRRVGDYVPPARAAASSAAIARLWWGVAKW